MSKVGNNYEKSKVIVDIYRETGNKFICSCYTPGAPSSLEPEYLVKTVSREELEKHIADKKGQVNVSFFLSDKKLISFDQYFSGLHSSHIQVYCAEVINKREGRTHLFSSTHKTAAA